MPDRNRKNGKIWTPTKRQAKAQRDMAEALVTRHLQESWPKDKDSPPTWFRDGPPPRYQEDLRTVAVVGAGASMPMVEVADELATELEEELETDKHSREVELERLENVYDLNPESFETRLTAICRTPEAERRVREKISERYRHHYPSLLTYELLAHLLHHRFLDAIISFNFDELLDQSIEDEMGPNEYTRVVTERDFDSDGSVSNPLYIKMHGTASEPDSLRFTRERYYWIPKSIIELVEQQFDVGHLVLINLGFAMESFDFQYLLRKPRELEIFHLDPYALTPGVEEGIQRQRRKQRERTKATRSNCYDAPTIADFSLFEKGAGVPPGKEPQSSFLEQALGETVDEIKRYSKTRAAKPTRWRSVLRHQAVVELLEDCDPSDPKHLHTYLRRRTILEIAFAAAKGRGVISIAAMVNERCGRYYELYADCAGDQAESWSKLCRAGGLIESPDWPDTYEVLNEIREKPSRRGAKVDIHRFQLADPEKLAVHVIRQLDVPGEAKRRLTRRLVETLGFLQEETEIEVHSSDDRVCSKLFAEPVILKTLTGLQGWTLELLKPDPAATETDEPHFDELRVVAETGGWLGKPEVQELLASQNLKVKLISAFDGTPKLPGKDPEIQKLPWGRHNRHMTILCNKGEPQAAIYFVRRLRAATVTPVYLSNQQDLKRVAKAFDKLWEEAEVYEDELERETALARAGASP